MERVVLRLMCDDRGEISFLFGPWGAVDRAKAIRQIESGERSYVLQQQDGSRTPIGTDGETLNAFGNGDYRLDAALQLRG
jgi:hypothetical protein